MERKLLTKRGRAAYRMRGKTVEPVFGQMKDGRGCDRFLLRGLAGARGEWRTLVRTFDLDPARRGACKRPYVRV